MTSAVPSMYSRCSCQIADVRVPWQAEADVLPLALFSHVATSCGVVGLDSSTLVPECPLAPELLQSSVL